MLWAVLLSKSESGLHAAVCNVCISLSVCWCLTRMQSADVWMKRGLWSSVYWSRDSWDSLSLYLLRATPAGGHYNYSWTPSLSSGVRSSSNWCATFCYGFRVERHVSWKRCTTGCEIRFLLFGGCVTNISPISSNMYINHAVLKRQLAQWVQVKSFTNVSAAARYTQQLKILEDMFVVTVL